MDIPPGAKVILKPGDTHAMLVGLKQPLKEGQTIPLTLDFEKGRQSQRGSFRCEGWRHARREYGIDGARG